MCVWRGRGRSQKGFNNVIPGITEVGGGGVFEGFQFNETIYSRPDASVPFLIIDSYRYKMRVCVEGFGGGGRSQLASKI